MDMTQFLCLSNDVGHLHGLWVMKLKIERCHISVLLNVLAHLGLEQSRMSSVKQHNGGKGTTVPDSGQKYIKEHAVSRSLQQQEIVNDPA